MKDANQLHIENCRILCFLSFTHIFASPLLQTPSCSVSFHCSFVSSMTKRFFFCNISSGINFMICLYRQSDGSQDWHLCDQFRSSVWHRHGKSYSSLHSASSFQQLRQHTVWSERSLNPSTAHFSSLNTRVVSNPNCIVTVVLKRLEALMNKIFPNVSETVNISLSLFVKTINP